MTEPFSRDEAVELKEAVVDALLGMLEARSTGHGASGESVYRDLPSRRFVSGFLLPRYDVQGDDEISDIRIAAHGMDFQLARDAVGVMRIRPRFSVYVRLLPSADDLFGTEMPARFQLRPSPRLKPEIEKEIANEIRDRLHATRPAGKESREAAAARRQTIMTEVMRGRGIVLVADTVQLGDAELAASDEASAGGSDEEPLLLADGQLGGGTAGPAPRHLELRAAARVVPDHLAVAIEVPFKWKRLSLLLPELELYLTQPRDEWPALVDAYNLDLADAVRGCVRDWLASAEGRDWGWRRGARILPSNYVNPEAWNQWLEVIRQQRVMLRDALPDLVPALLLEAATDPFAPDTVNLRVAIENRTQLPAGRIAVTMEFGLFQVSVEVDLPPCALRPLPLDRVKPSYHLTGFLEQPAIGVNGGVFHAPLREGDRLRTTWMPRFVQPRIVPRRLDAVVTNYDGLAAGTPDTIDGLLHLADEMDAWIAQTQTEVDLLAGIDPADQLAIDREKARFTADLEAWKAEAAAIRAGADLLARSRAAWERSPMNAEAPPFRAWMAMNKAFAEAGRAKNHTEWRLFQLAFVVAHIPVFASRLPAFADCFRPEHEDQATLLYFPTGGGKSEAFYGILVFALMLDRLRGKKRGVTALIRYPLRLLTLQQAQRLMRLLAHAELVRRSIDPDGWPFEIGFWVGSGNTPNQTRRGSRVIDELGEVPRIDDGSVTEDRLRDHEYGSRGYQDAAHRFDKLGRCPFCDQPTGLRLVPEENHRLAIACLNDGCVWCMEEGGAPTALPFLVVDTDIYARAPAVILGTIDKLALIGNHPTTIGRIAGMFGLARWRNRMTKLLEMPDAGGVLEEGPGDDTELVAPAYTAGAEVFVDPLPSLIIQDEAHLLEESLGTFSGLFETTLAHWFEEIGTMLGGRALRRPDTGRPRLPRVIAATATVSDPERQVGSLYQKAVVQFPRPGARLYRSFYAFPDRFADPTRNAMASRVLDEERVAPWMRVYASLMTNGRPHTSTMVAVLSTHHVLITGLLDDLRSADPVVQASAVERLRAHLSDPLLRPRHDAVLARATSETRFAELAGIVDLHRIALTYVTNKKGGDQLLSALQSVVFEDHRRDGRTIGQLDNRLISGGVDVAAIQDIIRLAETAPAAEGRPLDELLRGIVATSAISHGVDVDRFNAMFFAGMPPDIAEYIQASSRVGRMHVGFVVLIPTPQARRDRFVVEVHEVFHRFLERMIAPPAVERWADRAIERVVPSLFQTWLIGIVSQRAFLAAVDDGKHRARRFKTVDDIEHFLRAQGRRRVITEASDFILAAIGADHPTWHAADRPHYADLVERALNDIVSQVEGGFYAGATLPQFWKACHNVAHAPMTSLRDVDTGGVIYPSRYTDRMQSIRSDDIGAIMGFIRTGRAGGPADAEIDADTKVGLAIEAGQ